ncbi:MAG: hypothetical protein HQK49_01185 [Oligoflexia bacterium]|nr:hypothetical protein [Oligoflexia bacterium]
MFYINCFFKTIRHSPICGSIFILMSSLLFLAGYQGEYLQKKFWQYYGEDLFYPYFYVLFQGEKNLQLAQTQLSKLPGIIKIYIQDKNVLSETVKKSFSEVNLPLAISSELDSNFYGMKIILEPDISVDSTNLIKKYIDHLFKNGNISSTAIKIRYKSNNQYDRSIVLLLKKWGGVILLIFLIILWPLSYYIFMLPNKKIFYLMELYQRRSHIGIKVIIPIMIIINLIIACSSLFINTPSYFGLLSLIVLTILIILTVEYKKYDCFDKL